MASKSSRRRRKQARRYKPKVGAIDPHVMQLLNEVAHASVLLPTVLEAVDHEAELDGRIDDAVTQLVQGLRGYDPLGTLETIRMMTLPFAQAGVMPPASAQGGLTLCEMLAIALLSSASEQHPGQEARRVDQALCVALAERLVPLAKELLQLADLRDLLTAGEFDDLAQVSLTVRANGRWMRGTSYPEAQESVVRGLFSPREVAAGTKALLGFDVEDALAFLNTCHQMQIDLLNERGQLFADAVNSLDTFHQHAPTHSEKRVASAAFAGLFNPSPSQSAVPLGDVAARAGLSDAVGRKVAEFFELKALQGGAAEGLRAFLNGNSPTRTHPLIRHEDLVMIVHPALIADAVKASVEDALKNSAYWDVYAAHRGRFLEARIAEVFGRLVPGAVQHHGIEFLVPADDLDSTGDTAAYTQLAECDHLFILHDVAFIVEDKSIPLGERSRSGELGPLRRNLAAAITKGSQQALRMKRRIMEDRGLRLRNGEWLDLSDVREIHSVVTSLDDMPGIATATAQLTRANVLHPDEIAWTVSLNDLDLIAQLVSRPAEFLLYVRRRTFPIATEIFMAVDELDLFLIFLQTGLFVEADPAQAADVLPWLGEPRPGDVRRYKRQMAALVTSHTDSLDAWFYSRQSHHEGGSVPAEAAPKPQMAPTRLTPLIDQLQAMSVFGWLSIGATLLAGSSSAQRKLADYPGALIKDPDAKGRPRSIAIPWGFSKQGGWLLVWMTRPQAMNPKAVLNRAREYLVAKRNQLGYRRAAAFVYDEVSGELIWALYDAGQTELDPEVLSKLISALRPLGDTDTQAQFTQRRRAASHARRKQGRRR